MTKDEFIKKFGIVTDKMDGKKKEYWEIVNQTRWDIICDIQGLIINIVDEARDYLDEEDFYGVSNNMNSALKIEKDKSFIYYHKGLSDIVNASYCDFEVTTIVVEKIEEALKEITELLVVDFKTEYLNNHRCKLLELCEEMFS